MVLKTGNEDMEKIHLHSQTREKAVIAAVKVIVDIISEGDQDAEHISSKYVIGILQEAIRRVQMKAELRPIKDFLSMQK